MTHGRLGTGQHDQLRFGPTVQNLLVGPARLRPAIQRHLSFIGKAFPDSFHRPISNLHGFGDLSVRAVFAAVIGLEQYPRPIDLPRRCPPTANERKQLRALQRAQFHDILLVHPEPPCWGLSGYRQCRLTRQSKWDGPLAVVQTRVTSTLASGRLCSEPWLVASPPDLLCTC